MIDMTEIKIWVGNLGKYNEGELVGDWFTLPHDVSDIMKTIGVADGTEYEEWEIFDWEGHSVVDINRYSNISELNNIAEELSSLSKRQFEVLSILVDQGILSNKTLTDISISIDEVISERSIRIHDGVSSTEDIARKFALESDDIKEDHPLYYYIDFEHYAKDIGLNNNAFPLNNEADVWVEWLN